MAAPPEPVLEPALELEPIGGGGLEPYAGATSLPIPPTCWSGWTTTPGACRQVAEVMLVIVEESGPISIERLGRRLVKAYGRTRLVDQRLAQLRALVPEQLRRDREEGFVRPASRDPLNWTGFRVGEDIMTRPVADIALLEIGNAMAYVARAGDGHRHRRAVQADFPAVRWQPADRERALLAGGSAAIGGLPRTTHRAWGVITATP